MLVYTRVFPASSISFFTGIEFHHLTEITIPRATGSIADNAFSYPTKMTVYGVTGTYAEEWAGGVSTASDGLGLKSGGLDLSHSFRLLPAAYLTSPDPNILNLATSVPTPTEPCEG